MAWKAGPLPKDTWFWGGLVLKKDYEQTTGGFYFADFYGSYAVIFPSGEHVEPHEIAFYDNGIELPPTPKGAPRDSAKRIG